MNITSIHRLSHFIIHLVILSSDPAETFLNHFLLLLAPSLNVFFLGQQHEERGLFLVR